MNNNESSADTDLADTEITNNNSESEPEFFPVSEGKLITLYIFSFGFYGLYWFYKNWKLQQPLMEKKIFPVWRAIFSIFFTHSLFNRIDKHAARLDNEHKFNAVILATIFVGAVILSNILDRALMFSGIPGNTILIASLLLFFLSAYPLVKVQATVNRINNDMLGYLNHKYSIWNYLLIGLGFFFWLVLALGILADSLGLIPVQ